MKKLVLDILDIVEYLLGLMWDILETLLYPIGCLLVPLLCAIPIAVLIVGIATMLVKLT